MAGLRLDPIDRKILAELQADGRMTNVELAKRVGISAPPCLRRVRTLEESGFIDKHVTLLKPEALGLNLTAFLGISMDRHTPDRFKAFEEAVQNFPEVLECAIVTGQSADYMLKVVVADMQHYESFLLGRLTRIEGVTGVHSSFVLRKIIDNTALPID